MNYQLVQHTGLERREERWIKDWLQREVELRAADPGDRLLAIFDVLDEWFQRSDFEGCSFINVLLEIAEPGHVVHQASRDYLARIRAFLGELAREAGVADPDAFARQWHILMKGSSRPVRGIVWPRGAPRKLARCSCVRGGPHHLKSTTGWPKAHEPSLPARSGRSWQLLLVHGGRV